MGVEEVVNASNLLAASNDMNDIPISTHVLFDILLAVFIFLSLLFNIMVSNAYYRNDHIITHQAILVLCLVGANLLWTIGIFPFSLSAAIIRTDAEKTSAGQWIFQDPVCGIVGFGNAFVPLGKLFTVILMLGERGVAILLEQHYKVLMNKYLFTAYVLFAWGMAFLCGVLPPAMGFYSEVNAGKGTCFPPLNVYAAIVFYIIYLIGGIVFIMLMAQRQRQRQRQLRHPAVEPALTTKSIETVGLATKQRRDIHGTIVIDYERGKFQTISPAESDGIVAKSPLRSELQGKKTTVRDKDLMDYDLHSGKSKMSKEYNGVLALFALYAITYLPFAITSVVRVPYGVDNVSMLMLYSTTWLDPLVLLLTRVLLRRAIDRMCFEICCVELQCCAKRGL